MKTLLRWLFKKYRQDFDTLYIEDLFGDVPKEVSEDTLRVLHKGKREFERFARWSAYLLQKKMIQPVRHAESYVGGLVFIQTMLTILNRFDHEKRIMADDVVVEATPDLAKAMEGVDDFFKRSGKQENNGKNS